MCDCINPPNQLKDNRNGQNQLNIYIDFITFNINNKVLQNKAQQIRGQVLNPDFKKASKTFWSL